MPIFVELYILKIDIYPRYTKELMILLYTTLYFFIFSMLSDTIKDVITYLNINSLEYLARN